MAGMIYVDGGIREMTPEEEVALEAARAESAARRGMAGPHAALLAYARQRRWEIETGGVTVNGVTIRTDEKSQAKMQGAAQLFDADPTLASIDWEAEPEVWIGVDAATLRAIGIAAGRHVQAVFSAFRAISAAITADPPTIASVTDVDAAYAAALPNSVSV